LKHTIIIVKEGIIVDASIVDTPLKPKGKTIYNVIEKTFNKLIGKVRFKVERTFGSVKKWFKGGVARYRGLEKMHTQNLIEAICYNQDRSPKRLGK